MYEDFNARDPWTEENMHCRWKANVVAIATRHADAVDIGFDVNGRTVWIAIPAVAWVEQKRRTGGTLTDRLAAQVAGRYLKQLIERGDAGRDLYTISTEEALELARGVMQEVGNTDALPALPVARPEPWDQNELVPSDVRR